MISTRTQAVLIFFLGLILFTVELGPQEIMGFESRFYLFALEVWRHGPDWFPTTYHHPYPDYPGTATFLIYAFSKLIGKLNRFTAVFPSAAASALTLAVTYLIGALHSRRLGLCAVLMLLFTVTFAQEARSISLDQFVTAMTVLCFYLVYSAQELKKPYRVAWIFPLFVLGFAFRGPLGLVIPTGVVCMFYLTGKKYQRFFVVGVIATLLLILCTTLLLWLAQKVGGKDFQHDVMMMELIGRIQDVQTPARLFYFKESFGAYAITYPLAILVMFGMIGDYEAKKFLKKFLAWALIIFIGLSIPADKKIRYILPAAPALALMCSYLFVVAQEQRFYYFVRRVFVACCFIFPALCLAGVLFVHKQYAELNIYFHDAIYSLVILQIAMFFVRRKEIAILFIAVVAFWGALIFVVEPIDLSLNQTQAFVQQLETLRLKKHAKLVFYHEGSDGWVIKYLVNMPREEQPYFIDSMLELTKTNMPEFIVVTEENFQAIPHHAALHIIARGKIGHVPVIVFSENI